MKSIHTISFALFFLLFMVACQENETMPTNNELFEEMVNALGGQAALQSANHIRYNSTGVAFEFQEDPEPVNGKVADYTFTLLYNLDGTQSQQAWHVEAEYAYATTFTFTETIDHTNGKSTGATGTFPTYFAGFGVQGDPMFSTKLAARQKTLMMSSPLAMAKLILANNSEKGTTYGTVKTNFNTSSLGFGGTTPDIELVVNTSTKLPEKAQVLENDPLLGDVLYEVIYSDWTTINGIQVPQKLEHRLDGNVIRTETFSNLTINPTFNATDLTVTANDAWPYDATQAQYGHLSSQMHFRTIMQTFPLDFPVEYVEQTSPLALPSEPVANDNDAYRVSGDYQSHYTYAFKVDGGLLIYDSPINDRRSAAVLAKIRSSFSTLPIKYVVNSHNHFDHTGGTRGNLAEGGDLIVGAGTKTFMEGILQRKSTVVPNPISGLNVNVIGIADSMVIGTGSEQVNLYTISTLHAEHDDYVVLYKPSTKTLYFNDLVNPGFINIFANMSAADQERTIDMAKEVVHFVDAHGLDVQTYHCSHGFTTQDFDFQTVRQLAAM